MFDDHGWPIGYNVRFNGKRANHGGPIRSADKLAGIWIAATTQPDGRITLDTAPA